MTRFHLWSNTDNFICCFFYDAVEGRKKLKGREAKVKTTRYEKQHIKNGKYRAFRNVLRHYKYL